MFTEYYGFSDEPFRLSPDPRFCYRHPTFAKGGAYMRYALRAAEGFVVITGSPGMGKTTLISDTTHSFGPGEYTVATMVNTLLAPDDVLRSAAYEFGLDADGVDTATVLHRLKQFFIHCHARRRPPLLVVDEAQNLSLYALEELRMLTNLDFEGKPLLQIFLVGQNQLRDNLQHPGLEQLRQRVTAAAHLKALNDDEVAGYLMHRLKVVGWRGSPKLKSSLLPVIQSACEGVPRRINQFCNRLFLYGAVDERRVLNAEVARVVLAEMSDERLHSRSGVDRVAERRVGRERRMGAVGGLSVFRDAGHHYGPVGAKPASTSGASGLSLIAGGLADGDRRVLAARVINPGFGQESGPVRAATAALDITVPTSVELEDSAPAAQRDLPPQALVSLPSTVAPGAEIEPSVDPGQGGVDGVDETAKVPGKELVVVPGSSLEERKAWRMRVAGLPVQEDPHPGSQTDVAANSPVVPRLAWVSVVAAVLIAAIGFLMSTTTRP